MTPVVKGGLLRYSLSSDPKVLNPLLSEDSESSALEVYLWMPLFELDPETLDYIPALATSYHISADKKTYTFTLHKEAKWQDQSPVTSQDVQFTFDTLMNKKTNAAALRSYYGGISLQVKDPFTFSFHTETPQFDTLNFLVGFTPIQKKQFEHSQNFNKDRGIMNPVGNGPYLLKKYQRGQKIILKRNPIWWAQHLSQFQNRYNPNELIFCIIQDSHLVYEKFIKGDLDAIGFTAEQWSTQVTKTDKNKFMQHHIWALKQQNKAPKAYSYIGWNLKNPLFQDVKTRTALAHLIDYKKIIEKVYYDLSVQNTSPFGSLTSNSLPDLRKSDHLITYNRTKALALLKEAGWMHNGKGLLFKEIQNQKVPFQFKLETNANNSARLKIAQIIKENFKAAGIQVTIYATEWNALLQNINKRNFDAVLLGWTGSLFPNARQIWHSESEKDGGSNFISYHNPQVDLLIEKANREYNIQKRNKLMQEINFLIYKDQPYAFISEATHILAGLNKKISSQRWVAQYENAPAKDMFYLAK
jgi:ABC-type transport system substrate-binding protein